MPPESNVEEMAKIINNKVRLRKTDIDVTEVLNWMRGMERYVTSVELRDQFDWPLRETARRLMRLLAEEGKVVIADHPSRKRSYVYGLPKMKKPTAETFAKPNPKAKEPSHMRARNSFFKSKKQNSNL